MCYLRSLPFTHTCIKCARICTCCSYLAVILLLIVKQEKGTFVSYENNTLLSANAEWNSDNNKASYSHIVYQRLSHILNHPHILAPTHVEDKPVFVSTDVKGVILEVWCNHQKGYKLHVCSYY